MSRWARLWASLAACSFGALLTALAPVLPPVLPAGAEGDAVIVDKGWWWRLQAGAVTSLPPPPDVDPGELMVQGAPDGAQAIAAIAVDVPEDRTATTLVLTVAEGGDQGGETAVLLACQAGSAWTGADAARWDTAPVVDCSQSVAAIRSDDGATWDVPVASLQFGQKINVVLVPGTVDGAPEGLDGSSFRLVFEEPTPASVATTAGGPAPTTDPPPPPVAFDDQLPGDGATPASPPYQPGSFSSPPVVAAEPAIEPELQGQTATAPRVQEATRPVLDPEPGDARTAARVVGALLLLGGLAFALISWRHAGAAATSAEAAAGGVGRFRRPRDGDPAPVS